MLLPIRDLSAALIPPRQFATRRWFSASPFWYYHHPGQRPQAPISPHFYDLIDPDLRELCHHLHRHGLATTPSCQGHFHPKPYFRQVWDQLQREDRLIRTEGLIVTDCESAQPYLFADPHHTLPWDRFATFYHDVAPEQAHGYLGIVLKAPDVSPGLLHIEVETPTPETQSRQWHDITAHAESLLCNFPASQMPDLRPLTAR